MKLTTKTAFQFWFVPPEVIPTTLFFKLPIACRDASRKLAIQQTLVVIDLLKTDFWFKPHSKGGFQSEIYSFSQLMLLILTC